MPRKTTETLTMHALATTATKPNKTIQPRPVTYAAFRQYLRTGDIALSRPDARPSNKLIALGTGSPYVHATMIGWCGGVLMLAEARQWSQSHLVTLSSQVKRGRDSTTCTGCGGLFVPRPPGRSCSAPPARPTAGGNCWAMRPQAVRPLGADEAQRSGGRLSPRLFGAGEFRLSGRRPHAPAGACRRGGRARPFRRRGLRPLRLHALLEG